MPVFFVLNLVAATLLILWPVWFSRRILHLPLLNPFTITLLISLPVEAMKLFGGPLVLLGDGLFDSGYQFAVLASNVLLVSQMVGLAFIFRCCTVFQVQQSLPLGRILLAPRGLRRAARLFLVLYLVAFWLLASSDFGLINWVINPREGYQLYRTGQGHWYALAISSLSVSMLLSFLAQPKPRSVLWRTPIYLGLAYLLGSKMVLLNIFTSTLIFLWFLDWKHLTKLLLFGAPLLFVVLIWNLFLALSDGFEVRAILEYFDFYKNAADYYHAYMNNEISLYWGKIASTSFTSYVPRALWTDKPSVYGILIINEIFYPGQAELTNTPAFGGAVEQFADFGFPGLVLNGLCGSFTILTAAASYLIFRNPGVDLRRVTPVIVVILLVQFVPTFGLFFPGLLYAILTLLVALTVALVRCRGRRFAVPARPAGVTAVRGQLAPANASRTDPAC